jgi:hypothetical protein
MRIVQIHSSVAIVADNHNLRNVLDLTDIPREQVPKHIIDEFDQLLLELKLERKKDEKF